MNLKRAMFGAVASLMLFGCGNGGVTLSVRAGAPKQPMGVRQAALTLDNGISVDRVRMVVRALKFDSTPEDAGGVDDSHELRSSPTLIDLEGAELTGALSEVITADVPAGTYPEADFEIDKLEDNEAGLAGFGDMVAEDASVIVDGTIDGAAFHFVTQAGAKQELPGPITIGEGANNVTLNLDITGWFGAAGARLDPRDPGSRSQIEEAIKASIDIIEDDDHDGAED